MNIFVCYTYSNSYLKAKSLNWHIKSVHQKEKDKSAHIKTVHENNRNIRCPNCEHNSTIKSLKIHIKRIHEDNTKSIKKTKTVNSQIDYILMKQNLKHKVVNCQSFFGSTLQTNHAIVIMNLKIDIKHLIFCSKRKKTKINSFQLNTNLNVQNEYKNKVESKLKSITLHDDFNNPT